jgi:hypothetical protein
MSRPIPINIAVEDILSDAVVRRLLQSSGRNFAIGATFSRGGYGYLKSRIDGFNNAAKGTPFFVLTDLDQCDCAPRLLNEWLSHVRHPNLIFRIAVREVEAWLLADQKGFAGFLGISSALIPRDLEQSDDPKSLLLELSKRSRYSELRKDLVPPPKSDRKVGPNYNGRLIEYVNNQWRPTRARHSSKSLDKAITTIKGFRIRYQADRVEEVG